MISDAEIIDRLTEVIKAQAELIKTLRNVIAMSGAGSAELDQRLEAVEEEQNGIISKLQP